MHRLIPIVLALLLCGCAVSSSEHNVARLDTRLPASPAYTYLVFRAYVGDLSVSLDGRTIYTFHDAASNGRLTMHAAHLPRDGAGKLVEFHVPHEQEQETCIGTHRYLATEATLPFALDLAATYAIRVDAWDILLGFVLFVIGAIVCAASFLRRRGDVLTLRSFGAFTLLYGLRVILQTSLPLFFGLELRAVSFASSFITYVIPIAGWAMPLRLIGNGWRSTLKLQVIAFTIFAPIGIIADFVTGTPFSLEVVNNVLVVIGGVNIFYNLLVARQRSSLELRVVLAGSLAFMLFALNSNLNHLGLLPWSYSDETPGFLVFVAALGFAATRSFVRGERDQLAIEHELNTAREIQQSILPRAMPDVPGLRFDAGYVPATSVGGDMYSFLSPDDAHAGVLVADVAGHGVPAALIASMVKIAVSSQAQLADDPGALLANLNAILRRDVRRAFVTATYLWFDMSARRVVVCNAGHPPPLLCRDGAFIELGDPGVLLGRFADARYASSATPLLAGDRIVAYTDGLPEARDAREEMFGEERLRELVRGGNAASVLAAVREWRKASDDADDLTIVIVDVA